MDGQSAEQSYQVNVQVDDAFDALVDGDDLARAAAAALRRCGAGRGELTVVVTDDEAVQALNREYRGVDAATDVLSFAAQESAEGERDLALPAELADELAGYLGDLVIAYPHAARQAGEYGATVAAELRMLTVHGVLHLLGMDHSAPDEEAAMWAVQDAVLAELGDPPSGQRVYH